MEKKASIFLVLALIFGILAAYVWATIPVNFSFMTVEPNFKMMDANGNLQTLSLWQLTTVTYPTTNKIQFGATVTATLGGLSSTRYKWWVNYEVWIKSITSGKQGRWDEFEVQGGGSWEGDSGWAAVWQDTWFTDADNKFDVAPEKKYWWLSGSGWSNAFSDGWIPLDPNTYNSFGDWIKWSSGLGETPKGDYEVKVNLRIKVNYEDNYGEEKTAIGPPALGGANGGINDFLIFTVNYQQGTLTISVTPKTSFTLIPLNIEGTLPPFAINFVEFFVNLGLPTWTTHIALSGLAVAFGAATYYYHRKEE